MFTVAPYYQIITQLGLKDSSRNLHAICVVSYFFRLYLILYICVQTFDVTGFKILLGDLDGTTCAMTRGVMRKRREK